MTALEREPSAVAETPAPARVARASGGAPQALLALQRAAGNSATVAALSRRRLTRCGAGGCTCGGKCGAKHGAEEEEFELQRAALAGGRALARAVAARSRRRASAAQRGSRGAMIR